MAAMADREADREMTTEAPVAPVVAVVGLGVRRMAPALGVLAKANTTPT